MRNWPGINCLSIPAVLALSLAACGSGNGDDLGGECEMGGMASSDRYLPFDVGNIWRYQVTDLTGNDPVSTKRQEYTMEFTPDGETEPVILQVTVKATGTTESWLRRTGEDVLRLQQQDFDPDGLLERTTLYQPPRIRLDETPDRITMGATWDENYTSVILDPLGAETDRIDVIDRWTITGVDVPCDAPWGTLECLQIHRERLQGGVAVKDYYFARGYGKVREEGSQLEELIGCSLQ